ncbi:L-ribulose-5-phosphate 4-epimerase [Mycoplasmopsis synoviae]|uniref:L-ribulose-5-phosphate 4-epimerase n=1 Tax=Mycoplasmopsis synoviae TaxID=2109 RepID=UPI000CA37442|nr:L-ribulose-5-phosphate 4-epimerase [Mycoplasmopsis synoviae]AKJ20956.1 L-ribulose-5-phosphate 4-epimerase [Mycoplasmopsis synoviae]AQU48291.1 L-ribulose-5-phosphate 4-epimerase [Mycoplasmopsis synoviae]AWL83876.1 L-ribulose-5-phosphate 4-epimerase [Mycoplasmopsis synoviae]QLE13605.1 L-ribulose-5-phosphate 4-epimerase [Mycoplasmopsis synoviae]UZF64358.1 L-ribulose-5-phosphate 4-epimerase [Mycoplasmopsis synoviae]
MNKIPSKYHKELQDLKKQVYEANMLLVKYNLVIHTWGNVSGITKDRKFMVIKPSGVSYEKLSWEDMVVTDLENNIYESKYNPSVDTPTHSLLYKENSQIKGIIHTHSINAVGFAQAGKEIPCYGTTHADNFYGPIPCTKALSKKEIESNYEHNTGLKIIKHFKENNLDFKATPAVLVKEHGPFAWSFKDPIDAVNIGLTLETVAKMALNTLLASWGKATPAQNELIQKHYDRKHSKNATYGQRK